MSDENINRYIRAVNYAAELHRGQKRKFSGDNYIVHPLRVARLLEVEDITPDEMIIAAVLHDTIEDCYTKELTRAQIYTHIKDTFGYDVGFMVFELTNQFTKDSCPNMNRSKRKLLELDRIKYIKPESKTIKCADRIDNLLDFHRYGGIPEYYRKESIDMFDEALRGQTTSKYFESMLEAILF